MSIELSRRSFLIGSAAVLAATQLPAAIATEPAVMESVWTKRSIFDIMLSCEQPQAVNEALRCRVYRTPLADDFSPPILDLACHPRSIIRWVAAPGNEIFVPKDQAVCFDVSPCLGDVHVHLLSFDNERRYSELYRWQNNRLVQSAVIPLDLGGWADSAEDDDCLEPIPPARGLSPTRGFIGWLMRRSA